MTILNILQKWHLLLGGPLRGLKAVVVTSALLCVPVVLVLAVITRSAGPVNTVLCIFATVVLVLVFLLVTRLSAKLNDLQAGVVLFRNLNTAGWRVDDLFPASGAADATLLLFLYKCLRVLRPKRVLELGSGQTTKLFSEYCQSNPGVEVITLEHEMSWMQRVAPY